MKTTVMLMAIGLLVVVGAVPDQDRTFNLRLKGHKHHGQLYHVKGYTEQEYPKDYPKGYPTQEYQKNPPVKEHQKGYPAQEYPKNPPPKEHQKGYPAQGFHKDYPPVEYPKGYDHYSSVYGSYQGHPGNYDFLYKYGYVDAAN